MTDDLEHDAEALDEYLRGYTAQNMTDGDSPVERSAVSVPSISAEVQLAATIKDLADKIQADPEFEAALESRLMQDARKDNRPAHSGFKLVRVVLWGSIIAVLLFGLIWALSNLAPHGPSPAAPPAVVKATETPDATQTAVNETQIPPATATLQPTASGEMFSLPIQPDADFFLQVPFQDSPAELALYQQIPWEPLTIENAKTTAARLGVDGQVYLSPAGPPGSENYFVWDGTGKVTFLGSPQVFDYQSGNPILFESPTCSPPCLAPGTEDVLQTFLEQRGLLDFPATTRPSNMQPQVMELVQLLDDIPLMVSPENYSGEALIGSQAQVLRLDYRPANLTPVGSFPILTSQQAWEQAASLQPVAGVQISSRTPPQTGSQVWQRSYPLNEQVEVFGSLQVYQSASPGGEALVLFDGFPVKGNTQGMADFSLNNPFIQVWGQFEQNNRGGRTLQVDGWQRSAFPSQYLEGTISRENDRAFLHTENQVLLLPDLPADVPEGISLSVSGVIIEQPEPTLSWSTISSASGGGGGGGSAFLKLNLEADSNFTTPATATPLPQVGTKVEALSGTPIVFIHQYEDGSSRVEVMFEIDQGQPDSPSGSAYLEGPGLAGIEAFHNLPVRIWGEFTTPTNNRQTINVERVEPVYPDLTLQTWLGRFEPATLEDKNVLLFTAQSGEQFVLGFSIDDPNRQIEFGPGDPVVIEGYVVPGRAVDGYPVIHDLAINPGQGLQDLSEYQPQRLQPFIMQESGTAGAAMKAAVSSIELVYLTEDARSAVLPAGSPLPYAQPVWRFSGTYEDGSLFQILVQALDPQYLVHP